MILDPKWHPNPVLVQYLQSVITSSSSSSSVHLLRLLHPSFTHPRLCSTCAPPSRHVPPPRYRTETFPLHLFHITLHTPISYYLSTQSHDSIRFDSIQSNWIRFWIFNTIVPSPNDDDVSYTVTRDARQKPATDQRTHQPICIFFSTWLASQSLASLPPPLLRQIRSSTRRSDTRAPSRLDSALCAAQEAGDFFVCSASVYCWYALLYGNGVVWCRSAY